MMAYRDTQDRQDRQDTQATDNRQTTDLRQIMNMDTLFGSADNTGEYFIIGAIVSLLLIGLTVIAAIVAQDVGTHIVIGFVYIVGAIVGAVIGGLLIAILVIQVGRVTLLVTERISNWRERGER